MTSARPTRPTSLACGSLRAFSLRLAARACGACPVRATPRRLRVLARLAALALAASPAALAGCAERAPGGPAPAAPAEGRHPNLVLVLADDLGWNDLSWHGSEIATPNIDRIFQQGVELERFYVSPMCTPTRAALLTGRSPVHFGLLFSVLTPWSQEGLPAREVTLAERLQQAGYATAAIGKWHLGHARPEYLPTAQGFEHFTGTLGGWIDYWSHRDPLHGTLDWQRDGAAVIETGYATRLLGDEALRFLERRDPERPFFLYFAPNAPHAPLQAPEESEARYRHLPDATRGTYAGVIDALDREVGRLLDALDREGIARRTIVVFLSDNGAVTSQGGHNNPLRGEKATTYEGGIRVPAALRWPGRLPGGRKSQQRMRDSDLFPTLLAAAEVAPLGAPAEGMNLWPVIQGEPERSREPFFFRIERKDFTWRAAIDGDWKLVTAEPTGYRQARTPQLFRLGRDPGERNDLAPSEPERVAELERRLSAWEELSPAAALRYSEPPPGWLPPDDLSALAKTPPRPQ
jgi:arylsulfatase A-like enzyme